jgi:hypothetical protein
MNDSSRSIEEVLNSFGENIVEALQKNLSSGGASTLRDSIHFQLEFDGEKYAFTLSLADYYYWVDKGRSAGKAPPLYPDVISKWIQNKGLQLDYKGLNKRPPGKNISLARLEKSLAFLIRRKIARKGTKGNNFYSSVLTPEALQQLQQDLSIAFKTDVSVQLKTMLNEFSK